MIQGDKILQIDMAIIFTCWIPWWFPPPYTKSNEPYIVNRADIHLFWVEVKVGLETLLPSGIEHLNLDLGLGLPWAKDDLAHIDAISCLKLEIEDTKPVLIGWQFMKEVAPILFALTSMFCNLCLKTIYDLLLVDFVDDVTIFLVELQSLE